MANNWREIFPENVLKKGQEYFDQGRVKNLKKTNYGYRATVVGSKTYTVDLELEDDGSLVFADCDCPIGFKYEPCKHVVAALLRYEESHRSKEEREQREFERQINTDALRSLYVKEPSEDDYQYINLLKIEKDILSDDKERNEAFKLLERGDVSYQSMRLAKPNMMGVSAITVIGTAKDSTDGYKKKECSFDISSDSIFNLRCSCKSCSAFYGYYWGPATGCKHIKALFYAAHRHLSEQQLLDYTDTKTMRMISDFQRSYASSVAKDITESINETLTLQPKIKDTGESLELSFKVGASKLYVIKNLSLFSNDVKAGNVETFGKSTKLKLSRESFSRDSIEYLDYIDDTIASINDGVRVAFSNGYDNGLRNNYNENYVKAYIPLSGRILDDFYDKFHNHGIDYESPEKSKKVIHFKEQNPKFKMEIKPKYNSSKKGDVFVGIRAECHFPPVYFGQTYAYYLENDNICRMSNDAYRKLRPLFNNKSGNYLFMDIGRNYLSDFYHTILPEFKQYIQVIENDSEVIDKYLTADVEFTFYLDAEHGNVFCKAIAAYDDNEYNVMDCLHLDVNSARSLQRERIYSKENEVLQKVKQYLPYFDETNGIFHCDKDEDIIYDFVITGVEELARLGEVQATDDFQHINVFKKPQITVGVSLSAGMLDLEVTTDDISREELLEILKSYRARKKYHRLRDNSYVDLNDEALATLDEMLSTLQISEKDFLKENIHIPAYRTLYLDKLLEENDGIYEDRDERFKELVKGFKTVKDAEFKAPESLSKIMRNYQKTGFKWISTLEKFGFGGILCDDMGLGKTLQTISFLLKHYTSVEEELPSLVVCPASLVFNWMDELSKFAPELNAVAIVGTVSEREEIIAHFKDYQVMVTSYDLLKRDVALYEDKEFYYEVIDEAQYIKNHNTAAAKAVKVINSRHRLALTGTPIENRLSELWSIFDFLMPGFLFKYEQFRRQFETPIVKYSEIEASDRLKKMVTPFLLRRLKENVLKELPEKIEKEQIVAMESSQRTLYDAQLSHLKMSIEEAKKNKSFDKDKLKILSEITRLRQICCDPALYVDNYNGESAKREACMDLVQRAIEAGHRILIFSQFTTMLDLLKKDLKKESIPFFEITGATKKEDRVDLVNRFNEGENDVFLISLKAGGTGLNLIGADVVIHYDPWWNLAAQNQATDRAHRIGQKKMVTVYKLITKGTIEEKIVELQKSKNDLADEILSGETNIISKMTEEDFLELLG